MRTARQTLAGVAVMALLAFGGTAAALAAPAAPQAAQAVAAPCDQLAAAIDRWQGVRDATAAAIGQLQQRIASGTLRPGPLRAARAIVAGLQRQLVRLDAGLARLNARYAELCAGGGGGGGGGGEETPPPPPQE